MASMRCGDVIWCPGMPKTFDCKPDVYMCELGGSKMPKCRCLRVLQCVLNVQLGNNKGDMELVQ